MTPVSHGKPCAGNPHARFEEGASASGKPRRNVLLHKVKSRMYASKLQTERSPVVKRVMVAETNTDAPKSFCDAPDGTGHRDMARSER